MKISKSFELLNSTLATLLQPGLREICTANQVAHQPAELSLALWSALKISDKNTPVLVFSDGVVKASGISESSIDMLVLQQLRELSVPFEHVIVAQVLNCSPESVHASVEAVSALKQFLGSRTAVPVLVIGSGSITDIVKHTLHELAWHSVPFVVMPTALTVTAFTSHFAVLEDSGAKRTRLSRRVNTCVWFTPVLASAPIDMTRAGYGDLLARFVAYGDWYLGWRLGVADRYDELAFHLMEPFGWHLRAHASALAAWPLRADTMEDLSAILSMAGIAMSVSGETTPLSGYEHTISHALDYLRLISHRPLAWHGQQVALASLASAESYDHLLQFESLNLHSVQPLSSAHIQRTIRQLLQNAPYFGPGEFSLTHEERLAGLVPLQESIARACELFSADYLKKHALWEKAFAKISDFEQQWPEIRAHLKTLVIPASDMRELIEKSGLALVPEELSQPTSALEYRWAVRFAPFVRSRMSLADLIFWIGEDPALWATI